MKFDSDEYQRLLAQRDRIDIDRDFMETADRDKADIERAKIDARMLELERCLENKHVMDKWNVLYFPTQPKP